MRVILDIAEFLARAGLMSDADVMELRQQGLLEPEPTERETRTVSEEEEEEKSP